MAFGQRSYKATRAVDAYAPLVLPRGGMDASEPLSLHSKVPTAGSGSDAAHGRAVGMGRHSQFGQNH